MTLKIISAAEVLFDGEVNAATLPGNMGSFTVLRNHASLVAMLTAGTVRYEAADGSVHTHDISGGVADVDNNVVTVCVY